MLQAFYTGLSGLNSYSQNLDNVSNNIANMNTAGYRGMDSFYQALGGDSGKPGLGSQISGLGYRFSVGDIRQTGNDFDLAITGTGFLLYWMMSRFFILVLVSLNLMKIMC
ncbi:flagellar hook-basal body complex protein [Shewanella woodyi]|uniref:flagellar hook-basal body complex protein n=1 Tax=Shewanella woodyi TaxID=60961 RepID=UPI0037499B8A